MTVALLVSRVERRALWKRADTIFRELEALNLQQDDGMGLPLSEHLSRDLSRLLADLGYSGRRSYEHSALAHSLLMDALDALTVDIDAPEEPRPIMVSGQQALTCGKYEMEYQPPPAERRAAELERAFDRWGYLHNRLTLLVRKKHAPGLIAAAQRAVDEAWREYMDLKEAVA